MCGVFLAVWPPYDLELVQHEPFDWIKSNDSVVIATNLYELPLRIMLGQLVVQFRRLHDVQGRALTVVLVMREFVFGMVVLSLLSLFYSSTWGYVERSHVPVDKFIFRGIYIQRYCRPHFPSSKIY